MSSEDFRNKLVTKQNKRQTEESFRQGLQSNYEYLTSKESQEYMNYVLYTLGKEIESEIPGVEFFLKGRTKSQASYSKKIEKVVKKGANENKKIFDTLGCCLVIKNIPFESEIEHKLCQKHLTERAKKYTQIEATKLKLSRIIKEYNELEKEEEDQLKEIELEIQELEAKTNKTEKEIEILERKIQYLEKADLRANKEIEHHKSHIEAIKQLINTYQQQYDMEDNEANNALARHVLNKVLDRPAISKKLGITRVPHRTKVHDGGKSGYYIAYHDSVTSLKVNEWMKKKQENSNKANLTKESEIKEDSNDIAMDNEKDWILEIQAMSVQNYKETQKDGKAQHSKCDGKERILPPLGETKEDHNRFREKVLRETPKNMVYQSSIKKGDGTTRKGRVYVCSDVENVTYHFLEALENNPELFKYIIGNEDLFSDKGEVVNKADRDI